ncbi:MAG TPA: xanthine/uracil permease [Clostridiales bacterium]|jgi:AGZA family xanthine/uracil permease-like MFS transporter|nr:xanthine/uracil permease [Clostridiales bacterium]
MSNLVPFILAVVAVIINGVPQLLYAQARGFALKPAGFAFLIGGLGNLFTGSVTPISAQAETITVASVKKNVRDNVSSVLLAALLMMGIAAFGGVNKISDFAGVAVVSGMMSGVGLILAGVSLDMFNQEKRTALISIVTAIAAYAIFFNSPNKVVWTIFISVVVSTADFLLLQKRRVDVTASVEEGRDYLPSSNEWRFWKKEYWKDFKVIKPRLNLAVILGALSLVMLNIGANISFGGITASIAGTTQNYDHLSFINSLADLPAALFGGPPIEAIISGTAGAPWPVACGIVFMFAMGILILLGVIGRLGRYLPSQSIAGFLLVIGFALTFAPNLSAVSNSDNPVSGYIALGVTAWSKNPFIGMVVGILVRYLGSYVGLV